MSQNGGLAVAEGRPRFPAAGRLFICMENTLYWHSQIADTSRSLGHGRIGYRDSITGGVHGIAPLVLGLGHHGIFQFSMKFRVLFDVNFELFWFSWVASIRGACLLGNPDSNIRKY